MTVLVLRAPAGIEMCHSNVGMGGPAGEFPGYAKKACHLLLPPHGDSTNSPPPNCMCEYNVASCCRRTAPAREDRRLDRRALRAAIKILPTSAQSLSNNYALPLLVGPDVALMKNRP